MSFSFQIQYEDEGPTSKLLIGEGTATGLMNADMCIAAAYEVKISTTVTQRMGEYTAPFISNISYDNPTQMHYRDGALYIADQGAEQSLLKTSLDNLVVLTLSDPLQQAMIDGVAPPATISNIAFYGEQTISLDVAPDSELGQLLSKVIAVMDDAGEAGDATGIQMFVVADRTGSLRELEIIVTRATFVGEYDTTLRIRVESVGAVEPILFPSYAR